MISNHENVRRLFPGTRDKVFLDAACVSLAPTNATAAISKFLEDAMLCPEATATDQHIAMDRSREAARGEAARLIGASVEEIAIVESTTAGLNAVIPALPLDDGDNVLLCELEFPQVAIPFHNMRRFKKVELRAVPHRNGLVTADDFANACDSRTKAICVSSVQWSTGLKLDLAAVSEIAVRRGAWLIVDGIQQLGASALDVSALHIDALACGGHKWLNAPFGCGFLYVRRSRLDRLEPLVRGYLTLEEPAGGWGEYFSTPEITPFRDYGYIGTARKFETGGTSNYPGAIGLGSSIRLINELGSSAIESHIGSISGELMEGLRRRGATVITPQQDGLRAGIVTFRLFREAKQDACLASFLAGKRIYVSVRYTAGIGGIRVSTHFFNDLNDVSRLLEAIDEFRTANSAVDELGSTASVG